MFLPETPTAQEGIMPHITVTSYAQAAAVFETAKNKANGKPLASSTRLYDRHWNADGVVLDAFAVQYHDTDVVTYFRDGRVRLDTGGWLTMSTRSRLDEFMPAGHRIISKEGRWFLVTPSATYAYRDGITFDLYGTVTGFEEPAVVAEQDAANKALDKRLAGYIAKITSESIANAEGDLDDEVTTDDLLAVLDTDVIHYDLLVLALERKGYRPYVYLDTAQRGTDWAVQTVRGAFRNLVRSACYQGARATKNGRTPLGADKKVWQRSA